jgi:hypothetical protein
MGYDLHIVRTADWFDAAKNPITREEVAKLIEADPDLEWSVSDYVDMKDETGAAARFPLIAWRGRSCFWWYRDQIICKDPDQDQMAKMIRMGDALKAQVIGDDGEKYVLRRKLFGRVSVQIVQP